MEGNHATPHYEISWSSESGWFVRVRIHNSIMYSDGLWKVFNNCGSPEHAFALANEWVKATLTAAEKERNR